MNAFDESEQGGWPAEIGGYEVVCELGSGASALALAPGRRSIVLKGLDSDCLVQAGAHAKLHPSIRDRLARVRELAHARVANLHGVEQDLGRAYLVWEYVEGQPLEEWARGVVAARDVLMAARELILTVESLHGRGIVHGAIHGRNVIVGGDGRLKLTHVSPLLYVDPQQDMAAIGAMFAEIAALRGEAAGSPLQRLAEAAAEPGGTLRAMGARAAALIDLRRDEESEAIEREADARRRRHSRGGAAIVVGVAILFSYGIRHYMGQITPRPPRAPEAPESMLKP